MNIFIKTLENKYIIQVNHEDTVLHLKYQIQALLNIDPIQQRLIFQGSPMTNESTLQKCGVYKNSVINLILGMMYNVV